MLTLAIRARDQLQANDAGPAADLQARAIRACLQGLSEASRRVYSARIQQYCAWANGAANGAANVALSRESVRAWLRSLELSGASAQVRNQSLAAIKRFSVEAAELELIPHNDAAQIARVRSKRVLGTRAGLWLDAAQMARLLELPDRSTLQGRRDACLLALLVGCGLRRSEACGVRLEQVRTMPGADGRMLLANLAGKGGRVRSVSVPRWAQQDIDSWIKDTKDTKGAQ